MLKIKHLYFQYDKVPIVNNLNLEIETGEIVAILGSSGSGKSTLLRLISGLEPIVRGEVYIDDTLVNNIEPERRKVGMVFQDYALFPHMTVYNNIAYSQKNKKDNPFVKELLEITEIYRHKDKYPHELSGGEKQRVAIARALCYKPKVLLLDEPFSNLDATLKDTLRIKLKKVLKHYNITTILVTHDEEDAKKIAGKHYFMADGKLEKLGK